jgi:cytochrome b involved in lipid metabolism
MYLSQDITNFVRNHPGGKEVVYKAVKESSDITKTFDNVGHSKTGINLSIYIQSISNLYLYLKPALNILNKYKEKTAHSSNNLKRLDEKFDMHFLATKLFTKEDEYFIHKTLGLSI